MNREHRYFPMERRYTHVAIDGEAWLINGRPTYAGQKYRDWKIEGLLLNSRMVQAIFDDENELTRVFWGYPDTGQWDPERNTEEFVSIMPEWRAHGLLGITVNLQGGSPLGYYRVGAVKERLHSLGIDASDDEIWAGLPGTGSQPWHSSAFDSDGHLKQPYLNRLIRVFDRADALGMVVILGLFYQGQDERLRDEDAVRRAVNEACCWVLDQGYTNVVIEVNNECNVSRYEHEILQPHRVHELIQQVKEFKSDERRLLVGTSYSGGQVPDDSVVSSSDFVLLHGNGVNDPNRIAYMVNEVRALPSYRPMPILFNEDDHYDFNRQRNNFTAALSRYASWGYFDPGEGAGGNPFFGNYVDGYQNPPVNWGINTRRKRAFFDLLHEVTSNQLRTRNK